MVIIGLYGSKPLRRNAIADRVSRSGLARLVVYEMVNPSVKAHLNPSAGGERAKRVVQMIADMGYARLDGIVFSDVRTYEEAEEIRKRGGVMWFVEGTPSSDIAIQRGDIAVTDTEGGDRHYLDPLEALSETFRRGTRRCHG